MVEFMDDIVRELTDVLEEELGAEEYEDTILFDDAEYSMLLRGEAGSVWVVLVLCVGLAS